jgi:hypothetical protein
MKIACLLLAAVLAARPGDPVVARLSRVSMFAFGGIGIAGIRTQGENDYRDLLSRGAAAKEDFEEVFAHGTPEAKVYALAALRQLDRTAYKSLVAPVRFSPIEVHVGRGCILGARRMGDLIKEIESGGYSAYLK